MRPIEAMIVGAGQRGHYVYGAWALENPGLLRFTALVDPDPAWRRRFGEAHEIPNDRRFSSIGRATSRGSLPGTWIVAGPDRTHHSAAMAAIECGAHLLVEKPIGATAEEAASLAQAAAASPAVTAAALVLREAPFFRAVHEVVSSGALGRLVSIHHGEHVASWHMAHSFVRGAWSRTAAATPFIVQKCCHDLDLIAWNLGTDPVAAVSSFGSCSWFHPANAPEDATGRCTDGCPVENCPYDARAIYLDERRTGWPVHVITDELDEGSRIAALTDGPYGVCAYRAGSDVVDRQVVSMETSDGVTVTLEADGHARFEHRTVAYRGTRGTLIGRFGAGQELTLIDSSSGSERPVPIGGVTGGHGGGDEGVLHAFVAAIQGLGPHPAGPVEVLEGHLLAFAAERSRITEAVVAMESLRSEAAATAPPWE